MSIANIATREIELPAMFAAPAIDRGDARRVILLHPRLDARLPEALAVFAAEDADLARRVIIVSPARARVMAMLGQMLSKPRWRCLRIAGAMGSIMWEGSNGGRIWYLPTETNRWTAPPTRVDRVYATDCHTLGLCLPDRTNAKAMFLSGELAERGHWFYELARKTEPEHVHRLTVEQIVEEWPEQEAEILPRTHPSYARAIELKDEPPRTMGVPFLVFARTRLVVRSDRPREAMTPMQRLEAEAQYGTPIVRFDVMPLQRRYLAMKRRALALGWPDKFLLLKFRRGGYTAVEQAQSYRMVADRPRSQVMTLAHTRDATQRIFAIARLMAERDPMSPGMVGDSKSAIEFKNGSKFFIGTAGSRGMSRGDTLQRVHGSEVAYWCPGPHQTRKQAELIAGLVGAAQYGEVVLETTANGSEHFRELYEAAKVTRGAWTPLFLRWFDDPQNRSKVGTYDPAEILETLSEAERALIDQHALDASQIAFRRHIAKTYGVLAAQEYPEDDTRCFLTSGTCYFLTDWIERLLRELPVQDGCRREIAGGYEWTWAPPVPGRRYVAGCDTSEGLPGGDACGIGVLDAETGEQVAALHGYLNPTELAQHAVRLCRTYNEALLGIERQNHGHAVLQRVMQLGYDRPHFRGGPLYYWHQGDKILTSKPGWDTNSRTRPQMLADLAEAVHAGSMRVRDREFVSECGSFRKQSDGQWRADPGAHDDRVIKWAIAWQMRKDPPRKPSITVLGS